MESGRISNLLSNARACATRDALAKARMRNGYKCRSSCDTAVNTPVATAGDYLLSSACKNGYNGSAGAVPESIRIARVEQSTADCGYGGVNGSLPAYQNPKIRPIQICPPIPQWYYTAGEPKPQLTRCGLPNKPYNPVLPG